MTDDVTVGALVLDGVVGHLCDWHRVVAPKRAVTPGWYSPITIAACRTNIGHGRPLKV